MYAISYVAIQSGEFNSGAKLLKLLKTLANKAVSIPCVQKNTIITFWLRASIIKWKLLCIYAYFVCYSYRFRCLFYSNVSALRSGHHRIFLHGSSSKRTYIFHSKCIEVCKTWIKIVYIYRGIWCHTRPCVKTLRSANSWMNVRK